MNEDLRILADGYLEGNLSDDDLAQLEDRLLTDLAAKRQFMTYALLHGQLGAMADELRGSDTQEALTLDRVKTINIRTGATNEFVRFAGAIAVSVSILLASFWWLPQRRVPSVSNEIGYDWASIPSRTVGYVSLAGAEAKSLPVIAGSTASSQGSSLFTTNNSVSVQVASGSLFGFADDASGLLYRGSVDVSTTGPSDQYAIELGDQRVLSRGSRFALTKLDPDRTELQVIDGSVDIQTRLDGPRLRWSFDQHPDSLPILLQGHARKVAGIIGVGAVQLDGTRGTRVDIVGGSGDTVSSGAFAFSSGMTIECVVTTTWDGMENNAELIFRKEDGPNRILLGFQNNENDYEIPAVPKGPVLSFGIFIQGSGYSELDMPLDGQQGRPTVAEIANGLPHHIAATYDSFTGIKAIAVDGQVRFSHQFPVGQCIQSGGPKPASIGGWRNRETWSGIIDELAFYDYALSSEQIALHAENATRQSDWFQLQASSTSGWTTLKTVASGESIQLPTNHASNDAEMFMFHNSVIVFRRHRYPVR